MRAICPSRPLWALLLMLPLFAHAAGGDAARFGVRGELRPSASSDDGRFTLSGNARVTAQAASADGRFGLKSALASCDPLDSTVFRDGFESL
ncbi:MAG: hypothetical protein AMXMBFR25_26050 [Lysobacterales bacterium]|nr:hypothetical protein [Xanthomonadales bacterium]